MEGLIALLRYSAQLLGEAGAAFCVLVVLFLRYLPLGRPIYAVGDDDNAARVERAQAAHDVECDPDTSIEEKGVPNSCRPTSVHI